YLHSFPTRRSSDLLHEDTIRTGSLFRSYLSFVWTISWSWRRSAHHQKPLRTKKESAAHHAQKCRSYQMVAQILRDRSTSERIAMKNCICMVNNRACTLKRRPPHKRPDISYGEDC